ncbi:MAG: hypothetical protein AVDCRST_MAG54-638, partial [uncultured Actinomycetospora sp.]
DHSTRPGPHQLQHPRPPRGGRRRHRVRAGPREPAGRGGLVAAVPARGPGRPDDPARPARCRAAGAPRRRPGRGGARAHRARGVRQRVEPGRRRGPRRRALRRPPAARGRRAPGL